MQKDLAQIDRGLVNNAFYDTEHCAWSAPSGPLALLRAEGALKNKWILELLKNHGVAQPNVLDIGCGGGYLANELGRAGYQVTGVDLSEPSLAHARTEDKTKKVNYLKADAYALPFQNKSFEVVTCLDFLEHVSEPGQVVSEAARVLKPSGLFVYHTFSRNPVSYLIAIKGVEWFVKGTPDKLHVYNLFIKPEELHQELSKNRLEKIEERGLRPALNKQFLKLLLTREINEGFAFVWTKSKLVSYMGVARKS